MLLHGRGKKKRSSSSSSSILLSPSLAAAAAAAAASFPLPWVAEANLLPRITMAATGTEGGEALQAHWSAEEGGRRAERLRGGGVRVAHEDRDLASITIGLP